LIIHKPRLRHATQKKRVCDFSQTLS